MLLNNINIENSQENCNLLQVSVHLKLTYWTKSRVFYFLSVSQIYICFCFLYPRVQFIKFSENLHLEQLYSNRPAPVNNSKLSSFRLFEINVFASKISKIPNQNFIRNRIYIYMHHSNMIFLKIMFIFLIIFTSRNCEIVQKYLSFHTTKRRSFMRKMNGEAKMTHDMASFTIEIQIDQYQTK